MTPAKIGRSMKKCENRIYRTALADVADVAGGSINGIDGAEPGSGGTILPRVILTGAPA